MGFAGVAIPKEEPTQLLNRIENVSGRRLFLRQFVEFGFGKDSFAEMRSFKLDLSDTESLQVSDLHVCRETEEFFPSKLPFGCLLTDFVEVLCERYERTGGRAVVVKILSTLKIWISVDLDRSRLLIHNGSRFTKVGLDLTLAIRQQNRSCVGQMRSGCGSGKLHETRRLENNLGCWKLSPMNRRPRAHSEDPKHNTIIRLQLWS